MDFKLTQRQQDLAKTFFAACDAKLLVEQHHDSNIDKHDHPYTGAIGGSYTYSFTPTSSGVTVVLKHVGGRELDITEYAEW